MHFVQTINKGLDSLMVNARCSKKWKVPARFESSGVLSSQCFGTGLLLDDE